MIVQLHFTSLLFWGFMLLLHLVHISLLSPVSKSLCLWPPFCRPQGSCSSCSWCLRLLDEAGLEACAGFLRGGTGSCLLVGLIPLVGKAVSGNVSRGGVRLR